MRLSRRIVGMLLAALAVSQGFVDACGVAPPRNTPVAIADESAIIIWDSTSQREHFIRRASFKTSAEDFGFLVPTPTQPELSEVDDEAFTTLAKITEPRVETRQASSPGCIGC